MTPNKKSRTVDQSQRLFERGLVCLGQEHRLPVEVTRGMAILTSERQEAGKVAAVIVDKDSQKVTHVLLTRPRLTPDYRLVPVKLIEEVDENTVLLDICSQGIETLSVRQTS